MVPFRLLAPVKGQTLAAVLFFSGVMGRLSKAAARNPLVHLAISQCFSEEPKLKTEPWPNSAHKHPFKHEYRDEDKDNV